MLSEDLVDLIESGVSMTLATRDAERMPECARAFGARVHPDRTHLTIYVPCSTAGRTLANLAIEPRIAVSFSRTHDHRTYQLKGTATARDAREDERSMIESYRASFASSLDLSGIPRRLTMRARVWPAIALELEISDVFAQTPGPGAGARVGGTREGA